MTMALNPRACLLARPAFGRALLFDQVYAQPDKGELQCLRVVDGRRPWRMNLLRDFGAAFFGLVTNIVICTDGGQLVFIAADPVTSRELDRAQVCGLSWCNPAYADGRLYLRDGMRATGHLCCPELSP